MRIISGCLLTLWFTCFYSTIFAQTVPSALQGKVFTNNGPVSEATVVLLNYPDSSIVRSTLSNKSGEFIFSNIHKGNYLLFITKLQYNKSYSGPYVIDEGKSRDIGFITVSPSSAQLNGVTITGKKNLVEVKANKSVLNVDQNIMAAGSSLLDLLNTSPGIKVINDEILYRGGQKAMIAINGKPVLLTGEELMNLLRNYQSSSISQIELIDNAGVKYGAAAGGGMINIILKAKKDVGSTVSFTESAAVGDKYKFNTGINYNLRTEKLNLFVSYNYSDNSVPHLINTNRYINSNGQLDNFDLNYNADIKTRNHNFNIGADYQLTPLQTIGFLVDGFYNSADITKKSITDISTNGVLDSSIQGYSVISRNIYNLNYNLNYKAKLDKEGKSVLSADADYSDYHRSSEEALRNDFYNAAGQNENIPVFYSDNSPSHITIKSANIDFSQALSKSSRLNFGVKRSQVNSDNQIDFSQLFNGGYQAIPSLSDHFVYTERINAGYMQFESKFGKTTLSVGVRGEDTHFTDESINPSRHADSSYFSLFPNAELSQQIDKSNLLTLSYSRNIGRPNYQDLNPFVSFVDEFYSNKGNSFLKPDFINSYRISDLIADKYRIGLSTTITSNFFSGIYEQNDSTKAYITTKANLGTRYQYEAEFSLPVDITGWWHINAEIDAFHEHYAYKNDSVANKNTYGVTINLTQDFKLTSKLSAQLIGDYESPTYYAISQYKSLYWLNAGLRYAILNNKGSVRLAVSDIFNMHYDRYSSTYDGLDIYARDKVGVRFVTASFAYRFGSSSIKGRTKTTDEQKRLSGSNEN